MCSFRSHHKVTYAHRQGWHPIMTVMMLGGSPCLLGGSTLTCTSNTGWLQRVLNIRTCLKIKILQLKATRKCPGWCKTLSNYYLRRQNLSLTHTILKDGSFTPGRNMLYWLVKELKTNNQSIHADIDLWMDLTFHLHGLLWSIATKWTYKITTWLH